HGDDADAIGLVELAGQFGQQLVRRHADGAGQARGLEDAPLDQGGQFAAAVALDAGYVREVDVDLVDAAVLHHGRDVGGRLLEQAREAAYFVEVHRQQQAVRA